MRELSRLLVVSNRLPITLELIDGEIRSRQSTGGLVSGLLPILRGTGACWVGGMPASATDAYSRVPNSSPENYFLHPVMLSRREMMLYYNGFSNQIIWPSFHGLPALCRFGADFWNTYKSVNRKFAEAVRHVAEGDDLIWVHDYHLMLLAEKLRTIGASQRLAYFHHIPFPPPETLGVLPWCLDILRALMRFDLLGFQTAQDRDNFASSIRTHLNGVCVSDSEGKVVIRAEGQMAVAGAYPISVDYAALSAHASQPAITGLADLIRENFGNARLLLSVDRLDYTKGITERLIAVDTVLRRRPDLRERLKLLQVVVPSRTDVPAYRQLRQRIESLVRRINKRHRTAEWVPVEYLYRNLSQSELITLYRAADVAVVTPLKDGMNLVAKEFCASRADGDGVLVLSEFAGAAQELKCGAVMANPRETDLLASAIESALSLDDNERRARMRAMRLQIRLNDVFKWARSFNREQALAREIA